MRVELIQVETGKVAFEREVEAPRIAKNVHDLVKDVLFLLKDDSLIDSIIEIIFTHDFTQALEFEKVVGLGKEKMLFKLNV